MAWEFESCARNSVRTHLVQSSVVRLLAVLSVFAATLGVASPAEAAEVHYTYRGTITGSSVREIPVGTVMTVRYSIEDTTSESPLTASDPTIAVYAGAITKLSVEFAPDKFQPPFYTVVGDPDAAEVNEVEVRDRLSGDGYVAQLGSRSADGSLVGSPSLGTALPTTFDLFGSDTDGLTLGNTSIDVTQIEINRFIDRLTATTSAGSSMRFEDSSGAPAGAVGIRFDAVIVSSGNQAPTADPGGPYLGAQSDVISFDGSASFDPDGDPLTFDWDFGDGTSGTGEFATHSYASAGLYDVCLTVNDGTVNSPQACTTAVVYDPSAGFVTGGGWIDSPAGAYVPDPTQSGKASFGFVSKYKKGASIPSGNTQFSFLAGDLNFHSTSYDWLVVTGGDAAVFKGEGSLNGADGYKFKLWANDGDTDTFRIKIWTGEDDVVYDNGVAQPISQGSIIVHAR